jgi:hypothetical protein
MKDKNWKDIVELVGIAAIVGSLIFVGLQVRQDQQIAIAATFSTAIEATSNLATLIETNSETWKKGLDGGELSAADEIEFLAMVATVEAYQLNMYIRFDRLEIGDAERSFRTYAYAIYLHPGLREAFLKRTDFLAGRDESFDAASRSPFHESVASYLDHLDKNPPSIPSEKTYIFW